MFYFFNILDSDMIKQSKPIVFMARNLTGNQSSLKKDEHLLTGRQAFNAHKMAWIQLSSRTTALSGLAERRQCCV